MKEAWKAPRKLTSCGSTKQQCKILMQQISAFLHMLLQVILTFKAHVTPSTFKALSRHKINEYNRYDCSHFQICHRIPTVTYLNTFWYKWKFLTPQIWKQRALVRSSIVNSLYSIFVICEAIESFPNSNLAANTKRETANGLLHYQSLE